MEQYFATCARGIEPVLAEELAELGAANVQPGRGGVGFAGDRAMLYRANLWLRTAIRVLKPVLEASVASPEELYDAVRTVDWSRYLTPEHTLAVDCNVRDSPLTHSKYAALITKDAICDQFLDKHGRRPSVDVQEPMIALNLHIYRNQAVLSLDSSGVSLHKRGYRTILSKAPLNEALAAALVLLTGWHGDLAFADPFCGSGTLPIEAAWIALGRPPGLTRRRFGFQGWMDFDVRQWTDIRDASRRGIRNQLSAPIMGSDVRRDAIAFSHQSARAAGIGHLVWFEQKDIRDFAPPGEQPGVILCNPPYGGRIGQEKDLRQLYRALGKVFRERCAGWSAFVFTGNARLACEIGLEPKEEMRLFNGKIPCRLLKFELKT